MADSTSSIHSSLSLGLFNTNSVIVYNVDDFVDLLDPDVKSMFELLMSSPTELIILGSNFPERQ